MVKGKIVIRKINCSKSRQVTFFKRRTGLFKKAKELSILCDAQIGLFIFSCTGKLYEYASSSMKSLLERYGKVKQENNNLQCISALEIEILREETASLRQQISSLQESNKQLMGEEISKMSYEELKNLEAKLEAGLKNIRAKKEDVFQEEAKELLQKADLIDQENKELRMKLGLSIAKDYTKLKEEATPSIHPLPIPQPFEFLAADQDPDNNTGTLLLGDVAVHGSGTKNEELEESTKISDHLDHILNLKLSPPGSEL